MEKLEGRLDASGKRIGIVVGRWNELITKELLEGALDALRQCGDPEVLVAYVPGAWEIPIAAARLIEKRQTQAVVALGCILQGQTAHAGLLASDVGAALMALQARTGVPVAWGVLTPQTQEQALERSGVKKGNKGREAAMAAVEMISLLEQI